VSATTLGLRLPRTWTARRGARITIRVVLYLFVLAIFVLPLWSMVATSFSADPPKLG